MKIDFRVNLHLTIDLLLEMYYNKNGAGISRRSNL